MLDDSPNIEDVPIDLLSDNQRWPSIPFVVGVPLQNLRHRDPSHDSQKIYPWFCWFQLPFGKQKSLRQIKNEIVDK